MNVNPQTGARILLLIIIGIPGGVMVESIWEKPWSDRSRKVGAAIAATLLVALYIFLGWGLHWYPAHDAY